MVTVDGFEGVCAEDLESRGRWGLVEEDSFGVELLGLEGVAFALYSGFLELKGEEEKDISAAE